MNPIPAGVRIGAPLVERELRALPQETPLETVVQAAFKAALREDCSFMCRNDDETFRAGVGGLLMFYEDDHETRERILIEIKMLRALSAAQAGVPVDFADMVPDGFSALGLIPAFNAAKEESR